MFSNGSGWRMWITGSDFAQFDCPVVVRDTSQQPERRIRERL